MADATGSPNGAGSTTDFLYNSFPRDRPVLFLDTSVPTFSHTLAWAVLSSFSKATTDGSTLFTTVAGKVFFYAGDRVGSISTSRHNIPTAIADATVSRQHGAFSTTTAHFSPDTPRSSVPKMSVVSAKPDNDDSVTFLATSIIIPLASLAARVSYPMATFAELLLPTFHAPGGPVYILSPRKMSFGPVVHFLSYGVLGGGRRVTTGGDHGRGLGSHSPFSVLAEHSHAVYLAFSLPVLSVSFSVDISPFLQMSSLTWSVGGSLEIVDTFK